jgi:hypothetical protein
MSLLLVDPIDQSEFMDASLDRLLGMYDHGAGLSGTTLEGVVGVPRDPVVRSGTGLQTGLWSGLQSVWSAVS